MPFTFKLSKRLAVIRAGAIVGSAATVACAVTDSGPTSPSSQARVTQIITSPSTATVEAKEPKQFLAFGRTEAGDSVAVTVTWSATGGQVSATGVYAADTIPGDYQVTATSGSGSTAIKTSSKAILPKPGTVTDLAVAGTTLNSVTLAFTEVDDGTGKPAKYDVRYAAKPMSWASAADVRQGTCAVFMVGSAIGAKRTCTVLGLTTAGSYDFKLVAFRGGLNGNTVFGGVSNLTNAAPTSVASVQVSPAVSSGSVG